MSPGPRPLGGRPRPQVPAPGVRHRVGRPESPSSKRSDYSVEDGTSPSPLNSFLTRLISGKSVCALLRPPTPPYAPLRLPTPPYSPLHPPASSYLEVCESAESLGGLFLSP